MFGTNKALLGAVAGLLAGGLASPAAAQEPTTVTGCLSKGAAEGSFSVKGEDGTAYSLTSTTVKLDGHVGHKVTVTGTSAGMETGMAKDTATAKDTAMAKDTGMTKETGMAKDTAMTDHTGMAHDTSMAKDTGMTKETGAAGGAALNVTDLKMVSGACS